MKSIMFAALTALMLALPLSVQAAPAGAPDEVIRTTSQEVIAAIKNDPAIQAGDRRKIRALIEARVLPVFDFVRMTRLAMGRNWNQANADQQKQVVTQFRDLLVRTYGTALSQYKNQNVQVKGLEGKADDTDVVVHTAIVASGTQPVAIDYSMEKTDDGWKVFDIKVEGVSLVTNYRSEFGELVRKGGVEGLIHALDEKKKAAEKS
jgi:phospholipid transport system substrate-binding protein